MMYNIKKEKCQKLKKKEEEYETISKKRKI